MYIILLFIVVVLGLVIAFLYIRDREMTKLVLNLKNEIYKLKSSLGEENDEDKSKEYKELDDKIYEVGESLIKIVRNMKNIDAKQGIFEEKIKKLEDQLKKSTLSSSSTNEKKIISLFQEGKSIEEIASETMTPAGEVELIIKLANLNAN